MITCEICKQEFNNIISWKHLKKHNITTTEYKKIHGPLVSQEFRELKRSQNSGANNPNYANKLSDENKEKISKANKGKTAHNLGKPMSEEQKLMLSDKALLRNIEWRETGTHPVQGTTRTNETKQKIRDARALQVITSEAVYKAIATKRRNGYDLAFFRGKKHSPESKVKIAIASRRTGSKKTAAALANSTVLLEQVGYNIVAVDSTILSLQCHACKTTFTRSRQYLNPGKIVKELCPLCYPRNYDCSEQENQVAEFLESYTSVERNNRTIVKPKEIDIVLTEFNIGIEYNGLYWHSEVHKDAAYHLNKSNLAKVSNIQIVHVFEDEWVNKPEIVKSRLLSLIGKCPNKIFARKCTIKEVNSVIANQFINQHHLQGAGRANIKLGLYYNDELVSIMTFLKNDVSKRIVGWELNRFCSKINTTVVGGADKLFKHFVKNYDPERITSFSDRRWSSDHTVYTKLGFDFIHYSPPNYWYVRPNEIKRYHRYSLRKPSNCSVTERELRSQQGWLRIYDCGSSKWVWSREKAV